MLSHDFRGPPSYDYGHAIKNMIFLKNLISAQTHPTSMNPISAIVHNSSIPITSRLWLQLMDIVAEIEIEETKCWDFPHSIDSGASEFAFTGLARVWQEKMPFSFEPFSSYISTNLQVICIQNGMKLYLKHSKGWWCLKHSNF